MTSQQPWISGVKSKRGYAPAHFEDVFTRYLSDGAIPGDPSEPSNPADAETAPGASTADCGSDGSHVSDGMDFGDSYFEPEGDLPW